MNREGTRIHALESTVQRMASDLSSSKEQIKEVKELLLRLINPTAATQEPLPAFNRVPLVDLYPTQHTNEQDIPRPIHRDVIEHVPDVQGVRPSPKPMSPPSGPDNSADQFFCSQPPSNIPHRAPNCPSWASGDTIPVTPNSLLQKFRNKMPIGIAVSTEVSASIGNASQELSPHPSHEYTTPSQSQRQRRTGSPVSGSGNATCVNPANEAPDGVTTRRMATVTKSLQATPRQPREKFSVGLLPRLTSGAIAVNCLCFILHPDHGETVVAEGRAGASWKAPSAKYGNLCSEGEQMVQIHKIIVPNLRLAIVEDRQPFTVLEHALVKASGSSVYMKWMSRLLIKKPKKRPGVNGDHNP